MIIWSRWGIVVLLFVGAGVGLGFLVMNLVGIRAASGAVPGIFVGIGFLLSSIGLWAFSKFVVGTYIDKRQPAVMWEQLAEPVVAGNGAKQTHRVIPILHPETGQQVYTNPVSTFFFIPIRFWVFVLPAIGAVILVINLVIVVSGGR